MTLIFNKPDYGVAFQFKVESMDGQLFVIMGEHFNSWRTALSKLAAQSGHNGFSSNTLEAVPEGVYSQEDNTLAILFAPGTFLEHNDVEGNPIFLLISDRSCILTGSESIAGKKLIKNYQKIEIATSVVTIDGIWREWSAYSNAKEVALSYIAVTAGEVKPIWEGNHKTVAVGCGPCCNFNASPINFGDRTMLIKSLRQELAVNIGSEADQTKPLTLTPNPSQERTE